MKRSLLLLAVFVNALSGCHFRKAGSDIQAHDTVMSTGQVVEFANPNGSGKIIHISDFVRRYEIDGRGYDVKLMQREKEFDFRKGIYDPASTWGPLPFHDGVPSRFVVDESEIRFNTREECEIFFKEGAAYEKWVSNDQGLAVGFMLSPGRDQVSVSLFRCYIAGKLMKALPRQYRYPGYVRLR